MPRIGCSPVEIGIQRGDDGAMRFFPRFSAMTLVATLAMAGGVAVAADQPHNVVLFVPDGLRALMVDKQTAPTVAAVGDQGVAFQTRHSLCPPFTTPSASAMAPGHY